MPDDIAQAGATMRASLADLALIEGDITALLADAHERAGRLYGLTKAGAAQPQPHRAPGLPQLLTEMEQAAEEIARLPRMIRHRLAKLRAITNPAARPAPPTETSFRARHAGQS